MGQPEYPIERFVSFVESQLEGEPTLDNELLPRTARLRLGQPLLISLIDAVNVAQGTAGGVIPVERGGRALTPMHEIECCSEIAFGGALFSIYHIDGEDDIGIAGHAGDFFESEGLNEDEREASRIATINAMLDHLEDLQSRGELQRQDGGQ